MLVRYRVGSCNRGTILDEKYWMVGLISHYSHSIYMITRCHGRPGEGGVPDGELPPHRGPGDHPRPPEARQRGVVTVLGHWQPCKHSHRGSQEFRMEMVGKVANRQSNVRFVWKRPIHLCSRYCDKIHADKSNTSNIAAKNITLGNEQMNMFMGKEIFGKVSNQGIKEWLR